MASRSGRRAGPVTSSLTMFFASSATVLAFRAGCQARGCARCVCRPRAVRSLKFCSRSGEWPEQRCVPARLGGCNTALLARAATIAAGGHKCKQNGFSPHRYRHISKKTASIFILPAGTETFAPRPSTYLYIYLRGIRRYIYICPIIPTYT